MLLLTSQRKIYILLFNFIRSISFRFHREVFYEDNTGSLIDMLLYDKYLQDDVHFSSNKHECYLLQH